MSFIDFLYAPDISLTVFNQSSKYIKICYFSHKSRGSPVDKNKASNGFNSRVKAVVLLTFMAFIKMFIHNLTKCGCSS